MSACKDSEEMLPKRMADNISLLKIQQGQVQKLLPDYEVYLFDVEKWFLYEIQNSS